MSATDSSDVWAKLAAPLPVSAISWRQDGKPTQRDGKYSARFVAYIEAGTVRERLDSVVPGEWGLTLELLPQQADEDGTPMVGFKASLDVLSVNRECVGQGKDYKSAATDAFKRAAVRFGIGHELYQMEQLWVPVDSDSKYAKPLEDPATVYARKLGQGTVGVSTQQRRTPASSGADRTVSAPASTTPALRSSGAPTKRMPFGKHKGQELGEIASEDLVSTVKWCREKDAGKFADLIDACNDVLALRNDDDPMAVLTAGDDSDSLPF